MKTVSMIILSISLMVPTDKIQCPSTDIRIAVVTKNTKLVETIFKQHGLKINHSFRWREDGNCTTVVGQWQKEHTYKQARDLFFELAKQKEVLRIY